MVKTTDSEALLQRGGKLGAATLHEVMGRRGALPHELKPVASAMRIAGPAFPLRSPGGSNLALHKAIYAAAPGQVIVAHVSDAHAFGYWGEIMAHAARVRQLGGLVIDGCVRDGDLLEEIGFPVFARGLCIRGTAKEPGGVLNAPVTLGGVSVAPDDFVFGDRDGLVVVPRHDAARVIADGEAREAREAQILRRLDDGETTLEIYDLD